MRTKGPIFLIARHGMFTADSGSSCSGGFHGVLAVVDAHVPVCICSCANIKLIHMTYTQAHVPVCICSCANIKLIHICTYTQAHARWGGSRLGIRGFIPGQ